MATDLLSKIQTEIQERLAQLQPLIGEYERLLVAAGALEAGAGSDGGPQSAAPAVSAPRRGRRGSAAGALRRAAAPEEADSAGDAVQAEPVEKKQRQRAVRGAAREAILAALDHGSHTVGELVVVTAMSAPNINGNLRRLLSEKAVAKTEREGKVAYVLASRDED